MSLRFLAHQLRLAVPLRGSRCLSAMTRQFKFSAPLRKPLTSARCFSVSPHNDKVPTLGDSISEAVVVSFTKKVGDFVNEDEIYGVLETDKVSVEIRATKKGQVVKFFANQGDTVKVGQDLLQLDTAAVAATGPAASVMAPPAAAPNPSSTPPKTEKPAPASSAAKAPTPSAVSTVISASPPAPASPSPSGSRTQTSVPLSRMRMTIANRLKEAQNTAAMLTTFQEIDMKNIMDLRAKYKDDFEATHGVKMGFMSAFVKASAQALMKNPRVNAFFDVQNQCITYRDYVDISIAVSTPTGLVVPVLRDCHTMTFAGVESGIAALGKKARAGQIALEDMTGGTFTISNGGVYGSLMGTPILNPPQSAILGMHAINKRPIVVDDQIVIRPMMYVALTYDHRILDGKDGVTFLRDIKFGIEDPARLLLDL